jgi:hypothetical protein
VSQPTWIAMPGWLEVVDVATGLPSHINITHISVITPATTPDHTTLVAEGALGTTEIEVAESYSSVQNRLRMALELPTAMAARGW